MIVRNEYAKMLSTIPRAVQQLYVGVHVRNACETYTNFVPTPLADILSDVAILVLPIAAVSKLHMCLRKKLGVCAIFLVGVM